MNFHFYKKCLIFEYFYNQNKLAYELARLDNLEKILEMRKLVNQIAFQIYGNISKVRNGNCREEILT